MYSKRLEAYKKKLVLSDIQKQVLVGLLLGDGCLEILPKRDSARLKIEYTNKQKPYVDWLYRIFREWVRNPPKQEKNHTAHH